MTTAGSCTVKNRNTNGTRVTTRAPGEEHDIGPHDSGNGPAGTHGRNGGVEVGNGMRHTRAHAANQVEQQVAEMAEVVLDVVAKHPEEPHVADQVQPSAVQEHTG